MSNRIEAIEKEIAKLEKRIGAIEEQTPDSKQDQKIQKTTLSLLRDVIKDLRQQQKKLQKSNPEES